MSWSTIFDQPLAVRLLSQAIAAGKVAHAYLFTGAAGTGKKTVAIELAKVLNCASPSVEGACNECGSCRKISAGAHADVITVEPDGRSIKIDQMRELQRELYVRPAEGRRRIAIIDGADRMGVEAANSVLKLLEEPPAYATLILLAENAAGVLPTILSRCQLVGFRPLATETVRLALEKQGVESGQASVAAALSGGSLKRARELAENGEVNQGRTEIQTFLLGLARADSATLLTLAEEVESRKADVAEWLDLLLMWLRDALIVAQGANKRLLINADATEKLAEMASRFGVGRLVDMMDSVMQAMSQLQKNANTRLVLDVLLLRLSRLATS